MRNSLEYWDAWFSGSTKKSKLIYSVLSTSVLSVSAFLVLGTKGIGRFSCKAESMPGLLLVNLLMVYNLTKEEFTSLRQYFFNIKRYLID
jgi:hypothetical protein